MCGNVGVAGELLLEPSKKVFYDMLYFDTIRGEDSTGVALIRAPFGEKPFVNVLKSVGSPTDFFLQHGVPNRVRELNSHNVGIMIGHNRWATQGKISAETAHPFDFEKVCGTHNGTVNQYSLKNLHGYKDYFIDSQIIYAHLSRTGSIDEIWEVADGALSLVWWDKEKQTLNFIRNKERPMCIAYSEDDKVIYWASEMWMLHVAAGRQNVKIKEPFHTDVDTLYTFKNNEEGVMRHETRVLPPFTRPVSPNYARIWEDFLEDDEKVLPKNKKKTTTAIIRELYDSTIPPCAVAYDTFGQSIQVLIPTLQYPKIKQIIEDRGMGAGYYTIREKHFSTKGFDFWTAWNNLQYHHLGVGQSIIRDDKQGFRLITERDEKAWAPWHKPNLVLPKALWLTKVKAGCSNCDKIPPWGEHEGMRWIAHDTFICKQCMTLPFVQQLVAEYDAEQKEA